jgi:hypothetical protein
MGGLSFWYNKHMPLNIYETDIVYDVYDNPIEVCPLKLKYYKKFMNIYLTLKDEGKNEDQAIDILSQCVLIAMNQYAPGKYETYLHIQDSFDLQNIYRIIDAATGTKKAKEQDSKEELENVNEGTSWENLDLVRLELELFLTGIWKNIDELEESVSMPEMVAILSAKREKDYDEKKFMAAIQGVDLDKKSGQSRGQKEWEDMKARVFSKGQATDSKDVLSLQGVNAQKAGFGIGMGLDYQDLRTPNNG